MNKAIAGLEPESVWNHFYDLSQIPRCSGNEEAVGQHVIDMAEQLGFKWKKDHVGNIVIKKPATKGMEDRPACVIQGHLDMVCEKNKDTVHDFEKDPIKLVRDGEWITADGTTLGSDNGIAVAMALAVMESTDIPHPEMEFLFTVDEETGLTGANELKSDFVDGRILLNIDSEEEGALYIGCAGGQHTILEKEIDWESNGVFPRTYSLKVGGLRGGHSGLNIHEEFGNAIKLLGRFLYQLDQKIDFQLAGVEGGSKHNAIPREAEAIICLKEDQVDVIQKMASEYEKIFMEELKFVEKKVEITLSETKQTDKVFSEDLKNRVIRLLHAIPHGVMGMSHAVEGLVETSTNMAVIENQNGRIHMLTSQRSSIPSGVVDIASKVRALGELSTFNVEEGGGYPPWVPNPDSALLKTCKNIYKNKYSTEPEVKAIHAGLECGIIGEHYPGMDMISFGPDIEGAHSPDERIRISSVKHVWDYLLEILKEIK